MREVNTIRGRLYGNMVGQIASLTKFDVSVIYGRYEQNGAVPGCGFENFFTVGCNYKFNSS